jgi:hypothetical protein
MSAFRHFVLTLLDNVVFRTPDVINNVNKDLSTPLYASSAVSVYNNVAVSGGLDSQWEGYHALNIDDKYLFNPLDINQKTATFPLIYFLLLKTILVQAALSKFLLELENLADQCVFFQAYKS